MDGLGVSGKARREHLDLRLHALRGFRVPYAGCAVRKLEAADVGDSRRSACSALRDLRRAGTTSGQQPDDAGRVHRPNRACLQERDFDCRVRENQAF